MTADAAARAALVVYGLGIAVAFGLRTVVHRQRTGSGGFRGLSGRPGSAGWWGGISFAAALVLGAAGPAAAWAGAVVPPGRPPVLLTVAGLVLALVGFAGVVLAQGGMGSSWRIGVDADERTELVTGGAFAVVRNPIFTAMCTALLGLAAMVPTPVSVAAFGCLVVAVELQVRAVEEPYLRRVHGRDHAEYCAAVGRFVPGVGRSRPAGERRGRPRGHRRP